MSKGNHGGAHPYRGRRVGRAGRLMSKLGYAVTLRRLEQLLGRAQRIVAKARESQR